MQAWLDENDGSDGWTMVPACRRGAVNDAVAVYLRDAALEAAFVARWCAVDRAEVAKGRSGFAAMCRSRGCQRRGIGHLGAAGDHPPPSRSQPVLVCRSRETIASARPAGWSCRRCMDGALPDR